MSPTGQLAQLSPLTSHDPKCVHVRALGCVSQDPSWRIRREAQCPHCMDEGTAHRGRATPHAFLLLEGGGSHGSPTAWQHPQLGCFWFAQENTGPVTLSERALVSELGGGVSSGVSCFPQCDLGQVTWLLFALSSLPVKRGCSHWAGDT